MRKDIRGMSFFTTRGQNRQKKVKIAKEYILFD